MRWTPTDPMFGRFAACATEVEGIAIPQGAVMHVARAEIRAAVGALVERLPNLRLDPEAPAPRIIGMYERGPDAVPVVFD